MRILSLLMMLCWLGCPEPKAVDPQDTEKPKDETPAEPQGGEGEACFDNGNCLPGLLCDAQNVCVVPPPYDAGLGSSDGTGDGTSDGSGDGNSDGWADFLGGGDSDAGPTETVGWGEMCGSFLTPGPACEEGLMCGFLSGVCEELCDTPGSCSNCCPISGTGYCEAGVLVNFCQWESGAPPVTSSDAGVAMDAGPGEVAFDAGMSLLDSGTGPANQDSGWSVDGGAPMTDAGMPEVSGPNDAGHDGNASSVDAGASSSSAPADAGNHAFGGGNDAGVTVVAAICEEALAYPYFDVSTYTECDRDIATTEACTTLGGLPGFRRCTYAEVAEDVTLEIWTPCEEVCAGALNQTARPCLYDNVAGYEYCDEHYDYDTGTYVWGTCIPEECVACEPGDTKLCGADTPYPNTLQECVLQQGVPRWFDGDCYT